MLPKYLLVLLLIALLPAAAAAQALRVDEVAIEGTRRVEQSAVRSALSIKAGQEVTPEEIDRNLAAIYRLGRFADVAAEFEPRDGSQVLVP